MSRRNSYDDSFPIGVGTGEKTNILVAKNWARIEIFYHSYFADKTGFLEDLFRQTEALRALQGGRIIQHCYQKNRKKETNLF